MYVVLVPNCAKNHALIFKISCLQQLIMKHRHTDRQKDRQAERTENIISRPSTAGGRKRAATKVGVYRPRNGVRLQPLPLNPT